MQVKLKLVSANGAPVSVFWGGKNSFCSPSPFFPSLFAQEAKAMPGALRQESWGRWGKGRQ